MSTTTTDTTGHVIEIDFHNELGQRVLVLTCRKYRLPSIADDLGRCSHCGAPA